MNDDEFKLGSKPWLPLGIYILGVLACYSVNHSWLSGGSIYCAIRFITMGHDSIYQRSNEELAKRIIALEKPSNKS